MFFPFGNQFGSKKPIFAQSLHKMKTHFLAEKALISIDFIGDYRFPSG
jgi:hypothetical protein